MSVTRPQSVISLEGARRAIAGAFAKATDLGVAVNIAVADAGGNLVSFDRMDGAALMSASIAQDKAISVVSFKGLPTHAWTDLFAGDDESVGAGIPHRPGLVIFGGGIPIEIEGELVGAVGCSGGSSQEDRLIAEAGAAAVLGR
ncbi:GlcG/HbpS family heme-binding protein [Raineyella fluvialis]|uniref:Heme-binding protein n=1 Tax=Raineyella fluvialis TaxID=2662261 RepID=A0A5Q2FBE2_9ACTN|nr:heme-binding protein [Raineyella fluvialis]QGF24360.1 heme-binding protein [Raineyella fluvialis]